MEPRGVSDSSRRRYLLAMGSMLSLTGCVFNNDESIDETKRREDRFDTVLNAVSDLGVDNTGTAPIDQALDNAIEAGTLIEFPPGEYLVAERHSIEGIEQVGFRGTGNSRRDVRLMPPAGEHVRMFGAGETGVGQLLIENLSFDERNDAVSQVSLELWTQGGVLVKNVEFLGQTPDDNGPRSEFTIATDVLTKDGVAVYEDVYAGLDQGAKEVTYPDGVGFFYSGQSHSGEVKLKNPVIHERNSSATRYNGGPGIVTIEGGEFVNCQNAPVRFGAGNHPSKVSSATGTYVQIDGQINDTGEAVRIGGSEGAAESGAICQDLTIEWNKNNTRGVFSLVEFSPHGRLEIRDCAVRNNGTDTPIIFAGPSPIEDSEIIIENSKFVGAGDARFIAENRPGSIIRNCCIEMSDVSFTGFETENIYSSNCPAVLDPDQRG